MTGVTTNVSLLLTSLLSPFTEKEQKNTLKKRKEKERTTVPLLHYTQRTPQLTPFTSLAGKTFTVTFHRLPISFTLSPSRLHHRRRIQTHHHSRASVSLFLQPHATAHHHHLPKTLRRGNAGSNNSLFPQHTPLFHSIFRRKPLPPPHLTVSTSP